MSKKIEILYEDEHVAVIDKPSGLLVHPDGSNEGPFVTDWVLEKWPDTKDVGEALTLRTGEVISRPGIVHRLDRETSGCMVVAKTQEGFEHLKKQFQERTIEKIYNAFVYGNIKEEKGVIDRPIGKSRKNFMQWSAQRGARGALREAVTEYKVLKKGKIDPNPSNEQEGEVVTFLEVRPKTGRTHQIRVHMKAIHHPVVCDKLYAPNRPCLGFERLALHAKSMVFQNFEGKEVTTESSLPEDFQNTQMNLKE